MESDEQAEESAHEAGGWAVLALRVRRGGRPVEKAWGADARLRAFWTGFSASKPREEVLG